MFPGKRPLADVWALDTAAKPYEWRKLEPEGEGPPPCMCVLSRVSFICWLTVTLHLYCLSCEAFLCLACFDVVFHSLFIKL